jgi:predicted nucleic acid-binding protein
LEILLDENLIVVNEIILCELLPFLSVAGQKELVSLLQELPLQPLMINWQDIRHIQTKCLKQGYNGVGITDLIIAQDAIRHGTPLYTLDKHFSWISEFTHLKLFK